MSGGFRVGGAFVVAVFVVNMAVRAVGTVNVARFVVFAVAVFVVNVAVRAVGTVNVARFAARRRGRGKFAAENEERAGASDQKKKERDDGDKRRRSLIFGVFQFGHDILIFYADF